MSGWIAHVDIPSLIHAVIYGFVFHLMHQFTPGQDVVLVAVVPGVLFVRARSRDRRGWQDADSGTDHHRRECACTKCLQLIP